MKKRMAEAAGILVASVLLCAMSAHAEIADPADYMGDWYANYTMEELDGMRLNVAGLLECSYLFTFEEDGTGRCVMTALAEDAEEESEESSFTWEFADGKIAMKLDDGTEAILDEADGEVLIDTGEELWFVLGRELIQEELDWDALIDDALREENAQRAGVPKENPYVYDPEAANAEAVIAAVIKESNYGDEYEVAIDDTNGTFTADLAADEYSEAVHIEGTYEITPDHFITIKWTDEEYGFEKICESAEYAEKWDTFTVKEDLSNVADVIVAMANDQDYEHEYTVDSVTLTEISETEGTATLKDGDYEFTYDYTIVPGVDPILTISYYDEELEYTPQWENYSSRQWE